MTIEVYIIIFYHIGSFFSLVLIKLISYTIKFISNQGVRIQIFFDLGIIQLSLKVLEIFSVSILFLRGLYRKHTGYYRQQNLKQMNFK